MTTPNPTSVLISTTEELKDFLSTISASSTLCLNLEGKPWSRNGTLCIISIFVYPKKLVKLINVTVLSQQAFTTAASNGKSLKSILEDPNIPKCIWDVRNDVDSLFSLYEVGLAGAVDIQLLENASRSNPKTFVSSLEKAIQRDLKLSYTETQR